MVPPCVTVNLHLEFVNDILVSLCMTFAVYLTVTFLGLHYSHTEYRMLLITTICLQTVPTSSPDLLYCLFPAHSEIIEQSGVVKLFGDISDTYGAALISTCNLLKTMIDKLQISLPSNEHPVTQRKHGDTNCSQN